MASGFLAEHPGLMAGAAAFLVAAAVAAITVAVSGTSSEKLKRQRMDVYAPKPGRVGEVRDRRADLKRKQIDNKMKSLQEGKRHGGSRIGKVRVLILRAGMTMTITQFWLMCLAFGAIATILWNLEKMPPLGTPVVFFAATVVLPQMYLRIKASKRQKEFTKEFGGAIDIIVRGLKSGLPVQECFRIIGREIPDPCGAEFRTVINEVNAGLTPEEALGRSYERMPTQELRFFATVIAVQAQTGGNLAEILGSISGVLRGRAALREKIKALSSEAKASSAIVGALPFFVAGVLAVVNYAYISLLWTTHTGMIILSCALASMSFGMFVMNRMGKIDM